MSHKNREEQTVQDKMHEIIFGAHTTQGWLFDMALLVVIVLSVISNSLETVVGFENRWEDALFWASWVFTGLFTVEYALRIYCVKKPWRFIFSFWGIVDLLAILPEYLLFLFFSDGNSDEDCFTKYRTGNMVSNRPRAQVQTAASPPRRWEVRKTARRLPIPSDPPGMRRAVRARRRPPDSVRRGTKVHGQ